MTTGGPSCLHGGERRDQAGAGSHLSCEGRTGDWGRTGTRAGVRAYYIVSCDYRPITLRIGCIVTHSVCQQAAGVTSREAEVRRKLVAIRRMCPRSWPNPVVDRVGGLAGMRLSRRRDQEMCQMNVPGAPELSHLGWGSCGSQLALFGGQHGGDLPLERSVTDQRVSTVTYGSVYQGARAQAVADRGTGLKRTDSAADVLNRGWVAVVGRLVCSSRR